MRGSRSLIPALFFVAGLGLMALYVWMQWQEEPSITTPAATVAQAGATERTASAETAPAPAATLGSLAPAQTATAGATTPATRTAAAATVAPTVVPEMFSLGYEQRFGVTGFDDDVETVLDIGLPLSSYANWNVRVEPVRPQQISFWQVIRLHDGEVHTPREAIDDALAANRGATWLIGNEPDVVVQDNTTPERYAQLYHELYTYIKGQDPSARIAIGGVSQPTPLRRAYLDIVLDTYETLYGQRMPVDVWNVHAFVLREEEGEWGIGIPPGMDDTLAMQYEIADHTNLDIFARNLIDFREWMAQRGYADRPLLVSEYGFLMPYDFGFTPQDAVTFLNGTFDFMLNARNDTGFAPDGGRLVQWWLWFIVSAPDDEFVTSFLYDRESGQLTELGEAYGAFVRNNAP